MLELLQKAIRFVSGSHSAACLAFVLMFSFVTMLFLDFFTIGDLVSKETVCCVGGKMKH